MTKIAFVFPGQGSQSIGMGKELFDAFSIAKETLQEAEDVLSVKLSSLMFEGPLEDLTLTHNTQPALLVASMMAARVFDSQMGSSYKKNIHSLAGHSLGEYSALTYGGVIQFKDAIQAVRHRGLEMQKAVPVGEGAMAAILGMKASDVRVVDGCVVANDNSLEQVVISGTKEAVDQSMKLCLENGAKRAILLPVSAPFHSPFMKPAAKAMDVFLSNLSFSESQVDVIMNVTAQPLDGFEYVRPLLVQQICGQVRWTETVQYLVNQGVDLFVEVGSGKVLSGLIRRIATDVKVMNLQIPSDFDLLSDHLCQNC
ncbi:MAG: [acyl-carrier-protein] S-malonyltransferase [Candidatus Puniceispirillum sp.]|nr:[acyl-carrier-protein] S-malonyltransferase [Candidatus Pelagibacter sp.]MBA4283598.1 [acyl-carrier-protein] S-malonyltransferase [Candidatus Puniceispirillum sp.]